MSLPIRLTVFASILLLSSACTELGGFLTPTPSVSASPDASPSPSVSASPEASPSPTAVMPSPSATPVPGEGPTPVPQPTSGIAPNGGFIDTPAESVTVPSKFVRAEFPLSVSGNGSLTLNRNNVKPGKPLTLSFVAGTGFDESAWIGIIPSAIEHGDESLNDSHDLTFQQIKQRSSGEMTFTAPTQEGTFDFRMHPSDGGGSEAAAVSFMVSRELPPEELAASSMRLTQTRFKPGKPIVLQFTAPASFDEGAWIGLVPAEIEHGEESRNDSHDLTFQQIKQRTSGEMTFTAPTAEGRYDLRMHDNDSGGKEACYVSFIVTRDLPAAEIAASSLRLDKQSYRPGEKIMLTFTAAATFDESAWIGIIPSDVPHGEESVNDSHDLSFQMLKQQTQGTLTFYAPNTPGNYDFRMHDRDSNGKEVVAVGFTVAP